MSEKKDIKNSKEVILASKLIIGKIAAIAKDGFEFKDLKRLIPLFDDFPLLIAAIDDLGEIPEELKDLSGAEATELFKLFVELLKHVKAEYDAA